MKRGLFLRLLFVLSTSFAFYFGGAGHSILSASTMPDMAKQMTLNQCQSSCIPQSLLATQGPKSEIKDKDIDPEPAEPYYLAFIGVGWATVIIISAAYLLGYLHWRPPDLFKLNVNYRF